MNNSFTATVAAALLSVSGCETVKTTSQGAVGVDRKQQMLVSERPVEQGAAQGPMKPNSRLHATKAFLNTDKGATGARDHDCKRMVAATPAFRRPAGWNWQFNVQKTKELKPIACRAAIKD